MSDSDDSDAELFAIRPNKSVLKRARPEEDGGQEGPESAVNAAAAAAAGRPLGVVGDSNSNKNSSSGGGGDSGGDSKKKTKKMGGKELTPAQLARKRENDELVRRASLEECHWLKGYWGVSDIMVPCRRIMVPDRVLSQLNVLELKNKGLITTDPEVALAAVFWDEKTINFEERPLSEFVPFVPFDQEYTRNVGVLFPTQKKERGGRAAKRRKSAGAAKSKSEKRAKRVVDNLPKMLELFGDIYAAALAKKSSELQSGMECAEAAALADEEAKEENRLAAERKAREVAAPEHRIIAGGAELLALRAGDHVRLRDNVYKDVVCALVAGVSPAKEFPVHLDRAVGGSFMVDKATPAARTLSADEAMAALSALGQAADFDAAVEYTTEWKPVQEFALVESRMEGASFRDKFAADFLTTKKDLQAKLGDGLLH